MCQWQIKKCKCKQSSLNTSIIVRKPKRNVDKKTNEGTGEKRQKETFLSMSLEGIKEENKSLNDWHRRRLSRRCKGDLEFILKIQSLYN